jgi:hypothetical protein
MPCPHPSDEVALVTPTLVTRMIVAALAIATLVGLIDAALDGTWDHAALFGIAALLAVALLARLSLGRQDVRLRGDHVRWLLHRSELSGEPVEHVADRAIATYRSSLAEPPSPDAAAVPAADRPAP